MNRLPLIALIITIMLLLLPTAQAADITLGPHCDLSIAIIAANEDRAAGDCPAGRGADTIILTRNITIGVGGRGGVAAITSAITIEGNGYTISGDNLYRIFHNDGGALTIKDLTVTKSGVDRHDHDKTGSAIYNGGELSISNSTFRDNSADGYGGAGSAIYNEGKLSISDSTFSDNLTGRGGAIYNTGDGTLSITNSAFSDNWARYGGAIDNWGVLSITSSAFISNGALTGGAVYNEGKLSISNSVFHSNDGVFVGGAIFNAGELISIANSVFSGNTADLGGAIHNEGVEDLSIANSAFSDNLADEGGAIYNEGDEELNISSSAFGGNLAERGGGAIYNEGRLISIINSAFSDNLARYGGAIANWEGTLYVSVSAFSGNSADSGGGAILNTSELSISDSAFSDNSAKYGGAISNEGDEELNIVLSITNSAFSSNSVDFVGGAILNARELSISSSTFSGNSAKYGGAIGNWGELDIINNIIAGRGRDACYSDNRLRHNINNLIQDGSCFAVLSGDPMLGELVEPEDGSPAYFPLLEGSPAIDAADDEYCPDTDMLGAARPQGAACDIGAYERPQ